MSQLLEVRDLTVSFPGHHRGAPVVEDASLQVAAGETVSLVGESGSGKTVMALAIMGLLPYPGAKVAESSSIRLDGIEVAGAPGSKAVRGLRGRTAAMVFQDAGGALNPVRRLGSQLVEVLRRHRGLTGPAAATAAVGLLEEVGLDDPAGAARAFPHQLSGGMRQRGLIALALAGDPRLLVADEPTSALDATVQLQILDLIRDLTRSRSLGTLLITHDLGVVGHVSDRVMVMYAGRVVEEGPTPAVLAVPGHPYTRGLLDSLPRGGRSREPLRAIPGRMPAPHARGPGCHFRDRCARAAAECAREPRPTTVPGRGGTVRCWFPEVQGP